VEQVRQNVWTVTPSAFTGCQDPTTPLQKKADPARRTYYRQPYVPGPARQPYIPSFDRDVHPFVRSRRTSRLNDEHRLCHGLYSSVALGLSYVHFPKRHNREQLYTPTSFSKTDNWPCSATYMPRCFVRSRHTTVIERRHAMRHIPGDRSNEHRHRHGRCSSVALGLSTFTFRKGTIETAIYSHALLSCGVAQ